MSAKWYVSWAVSSFVVGGLAIGNVVSSSYEERVKDKVCDARLPRAAAEEAKRLGIPKIPGNVKYKPSRIEECSYETPDGRFRLIFKAIGEGLPPLVEAPAADVPASAPASAPAPAGR